jgi:MoaA/NifB/PqqE/SkfB family radical SAM enzyme
LKRGIQFSLFSWPIVNEYYEGGKEKFKLNITKAQFLQFVDENPGYIMCPDYSDKKYICGAGRVLFSISANGEVFPCSQFPKKMGNIKESSVEKIMKGKKMCGVACMSPKEIKKNE